MNLVAGHWSFALLPLNAIENEGQNNRAGELCAQLALRYDNLSEDERKLLEELSEMVEEFESRWNEEDKIEPRELLTFLMEQNNLIQKDLIPIFGSSSRISEYMSGKRELSLNQVIKLAKRFNLSPSAFIPKV